MKNVFISIVAFFAAVMAWEQAYIPAASAKQEDDPCMRARYLTAEDGSTYDTQAACEAAGGDWSTSGHCYEMCEIDIHAGSDNTGTDTPTHETEYEDHSTDTSHSGGGGSSGTTTGTTTADDIAERDEIIEDCQKMGQEMGGIYEECTSGKSCLNFASCMQAGDSADNCFAETVCGCVARDSGGGGDTVTTGTDASADAKDLTLVDEFQRGKSDSMYGVSTGYDQISTQRPEGYWKFIFWRLSGDMIGYIQSGGATDIAEDPAVTEAVTRMNAWVKSQTESQQRYECGASLAEVYNDSQKKPPPDTLNLDSK